MWRSRSSAPTQSAMRRLKQALLSQYLNFCTSKASKLSTCSSPPATCLGRRCAHFTCFTRTKVLILLASLAQSRGRRQLQGPHFTRFSDTKVQMLTPEARGEVGAEGGVGWRMGHLTVKTTTPLLFKSSKDRPTEENRKFSLAGEPGSPRSTAGSRGRPKPSSSVPENK
jgi:hypothetical protein